MLEDWYLFLALCIAVILIIELCWWEIKVCECAHLGSRAVVWLYSLLAPRYEQIKGYQLDLEDNYLGWPLAVTLSSIKSPRVLDVAAGTGRLAQSLLRQLSFNGTIVNVDLTAGMIREGRKLTENDSNRVNWVQGPANWLPFSDDTFDVVSCLEALELFPNARSAVAECVRVLRPGGWLMITNRIGVPALFIIGKVFTWTAFVQMLKQLSLEKVSIAPWQSNYDLALGRKRIAA